MEKLILNDFEFSVDEAELLRAVNIDSDDDPELAKEALGVIREGLSLSRPKAVCVCLPVETNEKTVNIGDISFENEFVAKKLSQSDICVPYVATCGAEVAAWAAGLSDPMHSWWAQELMLRLLSCAMKEVYATAKSRWFPDAPHMTALNPGSLEHWQIDGQKDLFAMLSGGGKEIGVELTPSMLMLPHKSGSGIFFSSSREYENCELCPRTDCPNRRAEFSGNTDWRLK